MKLTADRDVLAGAVSWAARALPQRPVVPIVAGMRIEAGDGHLTVAAFDYDTSATAQVNVDIGEPGIAVVPGRLLVEIVKSLPAKPVTLTADGGRLTVECGTARFTLVLLPAQEYPSLPEMPPPAGTIGAAAFAEAVTQVSPAAGRDDTFPVLTGIRVEVNAEAITLVATDRYRLAWRPVTWSPHTTEISTALTVPAANLAAAAKTMGAEREVTIGLEMDDGGGTPGILGLQAGALTLTTRLLGREYPNWGALIPGAPVAVAVVDAEPFAAAVRRAALVTIRNIPVRLVFTPGRVRVEAGTSGEDEAADVVDADFTGDDLMIAFHPGYLLDGVTACGTERVHVAFTSAARPAVISGEPDTSGYRYVIMPVRGTG